METAEWTMLRSATTPTRGHEDPGGDERESMGWKSPPGISRLSSLSRSTGSPLMGPRPSRRRAACPVDVRHQVGDRLAQRVDGARLAHEQRLGRQRCGCSRRARRSRSARERRRGRPRRTRRRRCSGSRRGRSLPARAGWSRWSRSGTSRRTCRTRRSRPSAAAGCRRRDDGVEAAPHGVVAARADLHAADAHAAAAVDAAVGLAHDEIVAEVGRVVVGGQPWKRFLKTSYSMP